MMEIERKILDINKKELISRINKIKPKPKKKFEGLVKVKYFDFPDSRIFKKKDLLRVREFIQCGKKPFCELVYKVYKGVKDGCKCFHETELKFDGKGYFEKLSEFMKMAGLKQTLYYEKKRTLFECGKVKFEIDEHPKIPAFVEIEALGAREIEKWIKKLGLENNEQSALSINELMERKYKIPLSGLVF